MSRVGAAQKCVTPSARISSQSRPGSVVSVHSDVAPAAATAHGKDQPLQWNIGSVHK